MALKITCGFGRVGVRASKVLGFPEEERQTKKHGQGNPQQRYETFKSVFTGGKENDLSFQAFCASVTHVGKVLNKWSQSSREEKAMFMEHFSVENWEKLNAEAKARHSIVGICTACRLEHATVWSYYNKRIKCTRTRNILGGRSPHTKEATGLEVEGEVQKKGKRPLKRSRVQQEDGSTAEERKRAKDRQFAIEFIERLRAIRAARRIRDEYDEAARIEDEYDEEVYEQVLKEYEL